MDKFPDIDVGDLLPLKDFLSLRLEGMDDLIPIFQEMTKALNQIERREREFTTN